MRGRHRTEGENVSVLQHVLAILAQMEIRFQQRFEAQERGVKDAMAAAEQARTKAEVAAEKRFELLNELRSGVATTGQVEGLEKRVNELSARIDRTEGRSTGLNAGWGYLVGAVGLIGAVIAIVVTLH